MFWVDRAKQRMVGEQRRGGYESVTSSATLMVEAELSKCDNSAKAECRFSNSVFWRRKQKLAESESVYDRLQREQSVVWEGEPITVGFDYQPYLKEPSRRRVNITAMQRNELDEILLVGYCHDAQQERTFKLTSVCGEVLVEKLGVSVLPGVFVNDLQAGKYQVA